MLQPEFFISNRHTVLVPVARRGLFGIKRSVKRVPFTSLTQANHYARGITRVTGRPVRIVSH